MKPERSAPKTFTGSGSAVLMHTPDLKIYMAKRLAEDRPFFGFYAGPGGSIEEGETPLEAAVREVREETGLKLDLMRFVLLTRTGPHLTPVEQHGSGKPYFMWYYAVELADNELPEVTEPHKQGPWVAKEWHGLKWIPPGTFNAIVKFLEPRANR